MTAFDARLDALRNRFRARAGGDRAALAAAAARGDREDLRRLAHGLAGSAGTFGFPEVSKAALAVEEGLDAGAGESAIRSLTEALLDRLDAVAG